MANANLDVKALQATIDTTKGGAWRASENQFTAMAPEQQELLLGYTPGPNDPSLEDSERMAAAKMRALAAAPREAFGFPSAYDLRNVGGKNYITSVKDQGSCGSCVAFGTVAAVEATYRRGRNDPSLAVDYSEAQLFYCHARSEGRRCGGTSGGWWPENALNAFRDKGVVDEACYPYTAGDQDCTGLCSDASNRTTKITAWRRLNTAAEMKDWISTKGPLVACYTVYQDFFAYTGGIYRHVSDVQRGGHCVCCVGYNDAQEYWICKNSWGPSFGESGYFRIGYGEVGIDGFMDAVDGVLDVAWQRDKRIIGLWSNNANRNAFVYVQGLGWRKIGGDTDSAFYCLLAQLSGAKAGSRRVDFYQENNVIQQVYVF